LYDDPYSWAESVHPEDYERAACFIDLAAGSRQEDKCEVEYRLVGPDKTVRWILDRGFAIRD
jgi:hypothetical protein